MQITLNFNPFFLTSLILFSFTAKSEVIFKPDAKNCRPYLGGKFKGCKAETVAFGLEPLTNTSLSYIQNLPVYASINFNLYCPSWPERESVDFKAGNTEVTLTATPEPKAGKVEVTIPYSKLNQAIVEFTPKFSPETTIEKTCLMETVSITSIPSKDFLSIVADSLSGSYEEVLGLKAEVEEAQELPAKFSALEAGIKNLDSAINTLNIEKNTFEADLASIPEESLEEREEATSIIENLKSVISDLVSTKSDIELIKPISRKCKLSNGTVTAAECLIQLDAVINKLSKSLSTKRSDIQKFNTFVDGEIRRLNSTASRLSRELQKIKITVE